MSYRYFNDYYNKLCCLNTLCESLWKNILLLYATNSKYDLPNINVKHNQTTLYATSRTKTINKQSGLTIDIDDIDIDKSFDLNSKIGSNSWTNMTPTNEINGDNMLIYDYSTVTDININRQYSNNYDHVIQTTTSYVEDIDDINQFKFNITHSDAKISIAGTWCDDIDNDIEIDINDDDDDESFKITEKQMDDLMDIIDQVDIDYDSDEK